MRLSIRDFPLIVILALVVCAAMMVPMLYAATLRQWDIARAFFYHGAFFAILATIFGIAMAHARWKATQQYQLAMLLLAYIVLPVLMAAPVEHLVPSITFGQAYFEMLSSMTTTGATVFDDASAIADTLHLWRALVSWMGGFLVLVAAVAILEPMQLGGFEIQAAFSPDTSRQRRSIGGAGGANVRLIHHVGEIAPVYVALTAALAILLNFAGDRSLVAVCHAMAVISTSAITPLKDFAESDAGYIGEAVILVFFVIVLTRKSQRLSLRRDNVGRILRDPELRIALIAVGAISGLLFLRHFLAALELDEQENLAGAARALWGSVFNVLSYLSTTGFDSRDWAVARDWSGLSTPGTILLGLCVMGGGIATTAGGVKLLRMYALYKHGVREMQRLIHPSSVGGAGMTARRIRREGANIAWIFLMLFLTSIGVVLLLLTAMGRDFEPSLSLAIAALTNTGPAAVLLDTGFSYAQLDGLELIVVSAAMIVGRLEILVFISLLNPDYWRR